VLLCTRLHSHFLSSSTTSTGLSPLYIRLSSFPSVSDRPPGSCWHNAFLPPAPLSHPPQGPSKCHFHACLSKFRHHRRLHQCPQTRPIPIPGRFLLSLLHELTGREHLHK